MNILEQVAIGNFVEILDVPKTKHEDGVKTVKSIATLIGLKINIY